MSESLTMDGAIRKRFDALEARREALTDRVRGLTPQQRAAHPDPKAFSALELLTHFALAEKNNLEYLFKDPPRTLTGRTPKTRFVYKKVVGGLNSATKRFGTPKAMVPKGPVTLEDGDRAWGAARIELASFLEQVDDLDDPFCQFMFLFGLGSVDDYLKLMEAHMRYHEVRFPKF